MRSLESRMATKTIVLPDGCWQWTGFIDKAGYGRVRGGGRDAPVVYCHIANYEKKHGQVPTGLELDHLCRRRWCCNPDHVEPVTHKANVMRGQSKSMLLHLAKKCARGHEATEANTYRYKQGKKAGNVAFCRVCRRADRAAATTKLRERPRKRSKR